MDTRRDQAVEIYHFKAGRKALLVDWPEQAVEKWIGVDEAGTIVMRSFHCAGRTYTGTI